MNKNNQDRVPIWHKLNLTIDEAAAYSNIGENRIREIINSDVTCNFVLNIGKNKKLIKRKEFEDWNSEINAI